MISEIIEALSTIVNKKSRRNLIDVNMVSDIYVNEDGMAYITLLFPVDNWPSSSAYFQLTLNEIEQKVNLIEGIASIVIDMKWVYNFRPFEPS